MKDLIVSRKECPHQGFKDELKISYFHKPVEYTFPELLTKATMLVVHSDQNDRNLGIHWYIFLAKM